MFFPIMGLFIFGANLWASIVNSYSLKNVYQESGAVVDETTLPEPYYPYAQDVDVFQEPDGKFIGVITRAVIYPKSTKNGWVNGDVYGWVWNADLTKGLGKARIISETAEFRPEADFVPIASFYLGSTLEKLYVNPKESWALCVINVWVRESDVRKEPRTNIPGFDERYPLFTIVSKEAGDVSGRATERTIFEHAPAIIILALGFFVVTINIVIASLSRIFRKETKHVTNTITISGVTSSSINVQSPFATALLAMEKSGKDDIALTLMQLRDLVESTKFNKGKKKEAIDLLDAIADESRKDKPKKIAVSTLVKELATILTSVSVISDKVPELIEKLSQALK